MVSYTIKPAAGEAMAFFCVVVMLGIRTPLVVLCASRMAEAEGEVVPIPTVDVSVVAPTTVSAPPTPTGPAMFAAS